MSSPNCFIVCYRCLTNNNAAKIVIATIIISVICLILAIPMMSIAKISFGLALVWVMALLLNVTSIIAFIVLLRDNIKHNLQYLSFSDSNVDRNAELNGTTSWGFTFFCLLWTPTWILLTWYFNNHDATSNEEYFIYNPAAIMLALPLNILVVIFFSMVLLFTIRIFISCVTYCHQEYNKTAVILGRHENLDDKPDIVVVTPASSNV